MSKRLLGTSLLLVSVVFCTMVLASPDLTEVEKKTLYVDPNTSYILAGDFIGAEKSNEDFGLFVYVCKEACSADTEYIGKTILLTDPQQAKSLLVIVGTLEDNKESKHQLISSIIKQINGQYKINPNKIFVISQWKDDLDLSNWQLGKNSKQARSPASSKIVGQNLIINPLEGVGAVKFGMSEEEIVKCLGKPDRIEGRKKECLNYSASLGLSLLVHRAQGLKLIDCWSSEAERFDVWNGGGTFGGATKEGIKIGATQKEIEAIYGKPDNIYKRGPDKIELHYTKIQTLFTIKCNKLVHMSLTALKRKT